MISNEISSLQEGAVNQLLSTVKRTKKKEYTFKAPTGSGKTYMMAMFCDKYLSENKDAVFFITSLSKANLAQQNFEKFEEYKASGNFRNLKNILISSNFSGEETPYIRDDENVYFLPHDLFKEKSILKKTGVLEGLLKKFTKNDFFSTSKKEVIWIRDECHIATSTIDKDLLKYFSFTVNFSATPKIKKGQVPDVLITDLEAVQTKLIKEIILQDKNESLEDAIKKYEEIQKNYINQLRKNPCLIIQISNKDKGNEEFTKIKEMLKKHDMLQWCAIFDDEKKCETNTNWKQKKIPVGKWKDLCKTDTSTINIIIFKLTITEGWDIPRACMLFQIRETHSEQLDEQVIGRIRRNPILNDFDSYSKESQDLALKAYLWGNLPTEQEICSVRLKDDLIEEDLFQNIKVKTTKLKSYKNQDSDFSFENEYSSYKKNLSSSVSNNNIFSLYKNLRNICFETREFIFSACSYNDWINRASAASFLDKKFNFYEEDYEKSMTVSEEVSFPKTSYFMKSPEYLKITNWVWKKKDKDSEFSFDSVAEKKFASLLQDISNKFLKAEDTTYKLDFDDNSSVMFYGKNFFPNSDIKFEYFNLGIHYSFPDFVVSDRNGKIHLFEVKSINKSNNSSIDNKNMKTK